MCFAYFKMNKFEKNPNKYIREKTSFLFSRGYKLKVFQRNAEYCFNFFLDDKELGDNHIYLFYENEYVDCTLSNAETAETNIKNLGVQFPLSFDIMTNMEKIDFFISCIKENIDKIDIRPMKKIDIALKFSKEKKHFEAYPIYGELYENEKNGINMFNLFQCAVYCERKEVEKELYEKLKCYAPNLKNEPIELSGCFVRYYYSLILCEVNRKSEVVEIIDYLIDVISHYDITDPTFLYIRGIPTAQMVYDLIKATFDNEKQLVEYKNKLFLILDSNTKNNEIFN